MAIDKKLIHFKTKENFLNALNGTEPTTGSEATGDALYGQIKGSSIVFINDTKEIGTHGTFFSSYETMNLEEIDAMCDSLFGEYASGSAIGEFEETV